MRSAGSAARTGEPCAGDVRTSFSGLLPGWRTKDFDILGRLDETVLPSPVPRKESPANQPGFVAFGQWCEVSGAGRLSPASDRHLLLLRLGRRGSPIGSILQ